MSRYIDADTFEANMQGEWERNEISNGNWIHFREMISDEPTIDAVPVVRCKDCRHFELNHFEKVNGIPLILAHEICIFWAGGAKTSADGYCSFGERKDG